MKDLVCASLLSLLSSRGVVLVAVRPCPRIYGIRRAAVNIDGAHTSTQRCPYVVLIIL